MKKKSGQLSLEFHRIAQDIADRRQPKIEAIVLIPYKEDGSQGGHWFTEKKYEDQIIKRLKKTHNKVISYTLEDYYKKYGRRS